jgi:hypothetical protein
MGAHHSPSKEESRMKLIDYYPDQDDNYREGDEENESFTVDHSEIGKVDVDGYRVTQRAMAKVRKAGLPRPQQYTKGGEPLDPKLDLRLASIDNGALGKLLVEFTAAAEYAAYLAAVADIDKTVEENVLQFVEAKVRLSKSGTVQRKADKTNVDPLVIEARAKFLEKDAIATLTITIQKNYERSLSTISREITRRQTELERRSS